jgi:hypothetical protein
VACRAKGKSVCHLVSVDPARSAKASSEGWRLRLRPNKGSEVCSLRIGPVCLYYGPSGPWGRTIRSPDQRGSPSAHSLCNCANCPAGVSGPSIGAKLVWAGTVCFWALVLRTVWGMSPDSTNSQVADRPALYGRQSACVKLIVVRALVLHVARFWTIRPRLADCSDFAFSDSSNLFQTGNLAFTCTMDRPA